MHFVDMKWFWLRHEFIFGDMKFYWRHETIFSATWINIWRHEIISATWNAFRRHEMILAPSWVHIWRHEILLSSWNDFIGDMNQYLASWNYFGVMKPLFSVTKRLFPSWINFLRLFGQLHQSSHVVSSQHVMSGQHSTPHDAVQVFIKFDSFMFACGTPFCTPHRLRREHISHRL